MACTSPSEASAAPSTSRWGPWVQIAIADPFYLPTAIAGQKTFIEERGFARGTVHNATALHWQFVANVDGKVLKDVWLYKDGGE